VAHREVGAGLELNVEGCAGIGSQNGYHIYGDPFKEQNSITD